MSLWSLEGGLGGSSKQPKPKRKRKVSAASKQKIRVSRALRNTTKYGMDRPATHFNRGYAERSVDHPKRWAQVVQSKRSQKHWRKCSKRAHKRLVDVDDGGNNLCKPKKRKSGKKSGKKSRKSGKKSPKSGKKSPKRISPKY